MTTYDTKKNKQVMLNVQTKNRLDTIRHSGEAYNAVILRLINTVSPSLPPVPKPSSKPTRKISLADAIKSTIETYDMQVFEISDLKSDLETTYPKLLRDEEDYHSMRAVIYHLKKADKLKKLGMGHSGKYQQIAPFSPALAKSRGT